MKPKPFWALNHLTVPEDMGIPFQSNDRHPLTPGVSAVEFAIR
jgi:hypothetical protein